MAPCAPPTAVRPVVHLPEAGPARFFRQPEPTQAARRVVGWQGHYSRRRVGQAAAVPKGTSSSAFPPGGKTADLHGFRRPRRPKVPQWYGSNRAYYVF